MTRRKDWFRAEDGTIYYLAYINKPIPAGSNVIEELFGSNHIENVPANLSTPEYFAQSPESQP